MKESLIIFFKYDHNGELFQRFCDLFLVDKRLNSLKLINHIGKEEKIQYSSNTEDSNQIHLVFNLKEVLDFMPRLFMAVEMKKNILIIIRNNYFDLIEYIYMDGESNYIKYNLK